MSLLYDRIGIGYAQFRRPDERIAGRIDAALGQSRSVLNVGAGAGSYEPTSRFVVAVEPSAEMIRQRSRMAAQSIQASADRLAVSGSLLRCRSRDSDDSSLAASRPGLAEMRRVARDRVVIFTWDPEHPGFWLVQEYFPEILAIDRPNFPTLEEIEKAIGPTEVLALPIPADCSDGFLGAYWRRPEAYLDARARAAISTFSKFDSAVGIARLRRDLEDGTWSDRYGALLPLPELDIGYRLVTARIA